MNQEEQKMHQEKQKMNREEQKMHSEEVTAGGAALVCAWWTLTEDRMSDCPLKQMGSC